ncbi:MAG: lysophospholipid acyltransferase family protein [Desulfatibacillaceae bacterium]
MPEYNMGKRTEEILYRLLRALFLVLGLIPRLWIRPVAKLAGHLWFAVDKRHRELAIDNMAKAYRLHRDSPWVRRIARENFVHLATVALEMPWVYRMGKKSTRNHVVWKDAHYIKPAFEGNKPVILITGHIGNWELMANALAMDFGPDLYVIVRTLDFPPLDRIVQEMRTRHGPKVMDKNSVADRVQELLSENRLVGILMDQNASWYDGVYVPFFGRTACTTKGVAMFSLFANAAVMPIFNKRLPDGRYEIRIEPAIYPVNTGDFKKDLVTNTIRYNRIIEAAVRDAPEQWLWVHRRWNLKNIPEKALKKLGRIPGADDEV